MLFLFLFQCPPRHALQRPTFGVLWLHVQHSITVFDGILVPLKLDERDGSIVVGGRGLL